MGYVEFLEREEGSDATAELEERTGQTGGRPRHGEEGRPADRAGQPAPPAPNAATTEEEYVTPDRLPS